MTGPTGTAGQDRYRDKDRWTFQEIMSVLEQMTGLPAEEIVVTCTIPEAKRMLAAGQSIPLEDVNIRMG